jgi:hypothetical protein
MQDRELVCLDFRHSPLALLQTQPTNRECNIRQGRGEQFLEIVAGKAFLEGRVTDWINAKRFGIVLIQTRNHLPNDLFNVVVPGI